MDGEDGGGSLAVDGMASIWGVADVDGSNQRNVKWVGYRADLICITNWHLNSLY